MKSVYFILILISYFCLSSCYDDKGNYTYHDINEVEIVDWNTGGYTIKLGDSLKITPALFFTLDQNPDDYEYEWAVTKKYEANSSERIVLGNERDLDVKLTIAPATYNLHCNIKDKITGVQWQFQSVLTVTAPTINEGYLLLCEVDGKARLDAIAYETVPNDQGTGTFTPIYDVLTAVGTKLPYGGTPLKVRTVLNGYPRTFTNSPTAERAGIYILTTEKTMLLNPLTLNYDSLNTAYIISVGMFPNDFHLQEMSKTTNRHWGVTPDGKVYFGSTSPSRIPWTASINTTYNSVVVEAAGWAIGGTSAVMFDKKSETFVRHPGSGQVFSAMNPNPVRFNYNQTGKDLLWMGICMQLTGTPITAILRDRTTQKIYIARFELGGVNQRYYEETTNTDLANASSIALSPEYEGWIFYSIGSKVYRYSTDNHSTKLMIDKTPEIITEINFQFFQNRLASTGVGPRNQLWEKKLRVCSYNPAGKEGSNGTMELFNVGNVDDELSSHAKYTGFGKIISVDFREP